LTNTINTFEDLKLKPELLAALNQLGFSTPTEIQKNAIPAALTGRNVIACAQTGSGKTLAFLIPIVSQLLENPKSNALIVTPTRELAEQIAKVIKTLFTGKISFPTSLLIGGASIIPQLRTLQKRPRVIVGTPGRINDHLERRSLNLSFFNIFVLDECDRMFDMGFAPQIKRIKQTMPQNKQTLLFSATLPKEVENIILRDLENPIQIGKPQTMAPSELLISQTVVNTDALKKNDTLLSEIAKREGSMIVFAKTKIRTDRLARFLHNKGISVERIHGDRNQSQRSKAIKSFRDGSVRVLVATDVAARGIDIPQIKTVVNYDLPQCAEDFIHRIGRTGRAGAKGESLSFVTDEDFRIWRDIQRMLNGNTDSSGPSRGFSGGGNRNFNRSRRGGGHRGQRRFGGGGGGGGRSGGGQGGGRGGFRGRRDSQQESPRF
jgi:ATP-dependent RNA helicase DeaD